MNKLIDTANADGRELFTVARQTVFGNWKKKLIRIRERMEMHVESQQEILAELTRHKKGILMHFNNPNRLRDERGKAAPFGNA